MSELEQDALLAALAACAFVADENRADATLVLGTFLVEAGVGPCVSLHALAGALLQIAVSLAEDSDVFRSMSVQMLEG